MTTNKKSLAQAEKLEPSHHSRREAESFAAPGHAPKETEPATSQQTAGNLAVQQSLRTEASSVTDEALRGPGQPLEHAVRTLMEKRFNRDFNQVRVHTDTRAGESAQALDARAFTLGRNIVFAAGEYAPGTIEGDRLLAHELTHTIQQGGGRSTPQSHSKMSEPNDPAEREADDVADRVLDGRPIAAPAVSAAGTLQRQQSGAQTGTHRDPSLPWPSRQGRAIHIITENIVTPEWLIAQGYRLVSGPSWPQHWIHPVTRDEVWRMHQTKGAETPRDQPPPQTSAPQVSQSGLATASYQAEFLTVYADKLEKELAELWKMQRDKDPQLKNRLIEFWKLQQDLDDKLDEAKARFSEWDADLSADEQTALDDQEERIVLLRDRFEKNLKVTPSGGF